MIFSLTKKCSANVYCTYNTGILMTGMAKKYRNGYGVIQLPQVGKMLNGTCNYFYKG